MSELVVGEPVGTALETVRAASRADVSRAATSRRTRTSLDDAIAFAGVSKYPARVKCALLGWMAMKGALAQASADADRGDRRMT